MINDKTNCLGVSRAYPLALCSLALVLVSCASPNSAQMAAENTAKVPGNVASVTATADVDPQSAPPALTRVGAASVLRHRAVCGVAIATTAHYLGWRGSNGQF